VVERYDREVPAHGNIVSLHQIDGCQLLGHGSAWKYERTGALVSLAKLAHALRDLGVRGQDMLAFQRWVMFNYLVGNADAHAKNLSLLIDGGRPGYRLAPFYDLVCVRAYGDTGLALFIGDEDTFDAVGMHSWEAFCQDCGFAVTETMKELHAMAAALLPAWDKVRARIGKDNAPTEAERAVLEKMTQVFRLHQGHAMSMLGAAQMR